MNKAKVVSVGVEARDRLIAGAQKLAEAVQSTLGPYGSNYVSGLKGEIRISNDGVSLARDFSCEDEMEDLGVRVLREAAIKTNDEAGDGTTTAIVLASAIVKGAVRNLRSKDAVKGNKSPVEVLKLIREETTAAIQKLKDMAVPVQSRAQLIEVAKVSVENDVLAELIGGTQWDLGKDGTILVEESNDQEDSIERINGIRIDNGFGTSLLLNDLEKQQLVVSGAKVIMTNHTIKDFKAIDKTLEALSKNNVTDVVIVARAFTQQAIQICMENFKRGFRMYPVNAPYTDQVQVMKDLASVLGGRFINDEETDFESLQLSDIGYADRVVATRWSAVFSGITDEKSTERVGKRVAELKETLSGSQSEFEKRMIEARISQLENGFALLKVGGWSLTERKYKKDKVDDAVNAAKAALQEGIVPGAGIALKTISEGMDDSSLTKAALRAPYEQIQANAGEPFDIPEWVKDPVKVTRIALEKAASVSATFATALTAVDWKKDRPMYVQEAPKQVQSGDEGV